jgi:hypothetical protein
MRLQRPHCNLQALLRSEQFQLCPCLFHECACASSSHCHFDFDQKGLDWLASAVAIDLASVGDCLVASTQKLGLECSCSIGVSADPVV